MSRNSTNMGSIANISVGPNNSRSRWIVALLLFSCAALWLAQGRAAGGPAASSSSTNLLARYPAGSIQTLEAADRALIEAGQERAGIEAGYALDERSCYPKFFATGCLDGAKERRRIALTRVRPVEIEANSFKRRARVVERDKTLAEQQAIEKSEAPQRRKDQMEHEARLTNKAAIDASEMKSGATGAERNQDAAGKRIIQHEIKLKRLQMEEIANAKKRAENVSAYEKKVQDAEQHRREVAARKADKERGRIGQDAPVSPSACCVKP